MLAYIKQPHEGLSLILHCRLAITSTGWEVLNMHGSATHLLAAVDEHRPHSFVFLYEPHNLLEKFSIQRNLLHFDTAAEQQKWYL